MSEFAEPFVALSYPALKENKSHIAALWAAANELEAGSLESFFGLHFFYSRNAKVR